MRLTGMRAAAAVAAVTLLAAACGSSGGGTGTGGGNPTSGSTGGGGTSAEPLKFGYVLPETGSLAYLGPPQIEAMKYAISLINKDGGVLGKELPAPVGGDEADDQAIANQSADRVLAGGVNAIIGAAASGMSLAIIDKVVGAGVAQCSGSNTAPTFTDQRSGEVDTGRYRNHASSNASSSRPVVCACRSACATSAGVSTMLAAIAAWRQVASVPPPPKRVLPRPPST